MMSAATSSDSIAINIVLAAAISPFFSCLFVGLRFYTARTILRKIHKDDWLILIALVFAIGFSITECIHTRYGLGYHLLDVLMMDPSPMEGYMIIGGIPSAITTYSSILFTKASILFFYLRFSTSRAFQYAVYLVLFVTVSYCTVGITTILYSCQPISKFWTFGEGTCIEASPIYSALVALNVATDVVILTLPFWILRPLRAGVVQKTAIGAILGTGGFVLGVSIFRLVIVIRGKDDWDFTYRHAINFMWGLIEHNVAIICACLPCLRALASRFFPALFTSTRSDGGTSTTSSIPDPRPRRPPMEERDPVIGDEEGKSILEVSPINTSWSGRRDRGQVLGSPSQVV
ncbi:hypothetical protein B0H63DRAFT_405919 [Podospora didyma]|uniref:Rhodopsin domain-containing protein n=1 Tax=Podospora didyma TaxID=330526 RepID=A0AAE0P3T3_9PEZI|nr:hypothetical protein B0H63DRAFT_405919 [Podospora didyma]